METRPPLPFCCYGVYVPRDFSREVIGAYAAGLATHVNSRRHLRFACAFFQPDGTLFSINPFLRSIQLKYISFWRRRITPPMHVVRSNTRVAIVCAKPAQPRILQFVECC